MDCKGDHHLDHRRVTDFADTWESLVFSAQCGQECAT